MKRKRDVAKMAAAEPGASAPPLKTALQGTKDDRLQLHYPQHEYRVLGESMGRGGGFMADNKDMMMLQQQKPLALPHRLPSSSLLPLPHQHHHSSLHHKRKHQDAIASCTSSTAAINTRSPGLQVPSYRSNPSPPRSSHRPPSSSNFSKHKKKLLKVILKLPKTHPHHPSSSLLSDHGSASSSSPSPSSDTPSPSTPPRASVPSPLPPPQQQPQQHLFERQHQHQHQHQEQQRLLQQQHYQQQQLLLQQQQQLKLQLDLKLQQQQQQQLKLQQHHPELLQHFKLQQQQQQQQQQQVKPCLEEPKRQKVQHQEVQQLSNSPKKAKSQQPSKLQPQKPSLHTPNSVKNFPRNPTPESRHQYGLSPTAQSCNVPSAPNPSFLPPPPLSAPLSSPLSLAATPSIDASDAGEKFSKKRKLKAVVDSLGNESHPSAATKVVTLQRLPVDGSTQSVRSGLLSASSTESQAHHPQLEGSAVKDRDVAGSFSKLSSDFQDLQPLPSKKLLEGILVKLQRKDTYGVFSEPVDPKLVPDYYDFIKDPLDFGTMRKRISTGYYTSLDLFQKDVFLVCNNAMRYNARDTIYFKQARSIQDAMRRILESLKTGGSQLEIDEVLPKQKLSLMKKLHKKHIIGHSSLERTASDHLADGSLISDGDRDGKIASQGFSGAASWNAERELANVLNSNHLSVSPSDAKPDNIADLPGSLAKSLGLKDGRRAQTYEENRRSTYRSQTKPAGGMATLLSSGDWQQLLPTGYQCDFPYARSLARFAADLGPAVWKVAAEKIRRALPPGFPFGPGWIGEREAPGGTFVAPLNKSQSHMSKALKPPTENRVFATGEAPSNREVLSKSDNTSPGTLLRACPSTPLSVDINNSPYHQSESKAQNSTAVPTQCSAELLELVKAAQQNQPNLQNMGHRTNGVADSFQIKHDEMPNKIQSASWGAGKQLEKSPISAELPVFFNEKYSGGNILNEFEVKDPMKSKSGIKSCSSMATGCASVKHGSHVGSSNHLSRSSHLLTNEDCILLDQSLLSSGPPMVQAHVHRQQQGSQAGPVALSENFSSVPSFSGSTSRVQEDGKIQGWIQSQQSDLSQVVGNACLKGPSQPSGTLMQCQSMGSAQYTQHQAKAGLQAGVASQHGNKFPANLPLFLQQQFAPDVYSFSQQQQIRLHRQGSSMPATQHGESVDTPGTSLSKQSSFPSQTATGITQTQNQARQYVAQFVLQSPELSYPVAPDLNASLRPTKSHFDNSTGSEVQQPDLALQL